MDDYINMSIGSPVSKSVFPMSISQSFCDLIFYHQRGIHVKLQHGFLFHRFLIPTVEVTGLIIEIDDIPKFRFKNKHGHAALFQEYFPVTCFAVIFLWFIRKRYYNAFCVGGDDTSSDPCSATPPRSASDSKSLSIPSAILRNRITLSLFSSNALKTPFSPNLNAPIAS